MTHTERIDLAVRRLAGSTNELVVLVEGLAAATAVTPLPGGWTPAQHVWHVALVDDVFGAVLNREHDVLESFPGASDYADAAWHLDAPPKPFPAPPFMIAPSTATPADAVSRIVAASDRLAAAARRLDPARAAGECVRLPWGVVSLYQMTEWGAGHTLRHIAQVRREMAAFV